MAKSIVISLKGVYPDLYDKNGNKRVSPIGVVSSYELKRNRLLILYKVMEVVLESEVISEETKIYVKNRYLSTSDVMRKINERDKTDKSFNQILSKITYDRRRIEEIVGSRFIEDILGGRTDIKELEKKYVDMVFRLSKDKLDVGKELIIEVSDRCIKREFKGDFLEEYGSVLAMYSRKRVETMQKMLEDNDEFVGYFNYLISGAKTEDDKVKGDREGLKEILEKGIYLGMTSEENISDQEKVYIEPDIGNGNAEENVENKKEPREEENRKENDEFGGDVEIVI